MTPEQALESLLPKRQDIPDPPRPNVVPHDGGRWMLVVVSETRTKKHWVIGSKKVRDIDSFKGTHYYKQMQVLEDEVRDELVDLDFGDAYERTVTIEDIARVYDP